MAVLSSAVVQHSSSSKCNSIRAVCRCRLVRMGLDPATAPYTKRPKTADTLSTKRLVKSGNTSSEMEHEYTSISRIELPSKSSFLLPPRRQKGIIHSIYNDQSSKHLTGSELVHSLENSVNNRIPFVSSMDA